MFPNMVSKKYKCKREKRKKKKGFVVTDHTEIIRKI